jgi:hypothetical protein
MVQLLRTIDEYIASYRSARIKRQNQNNRTWTFWSAISLEALDLDQLVVWCAGSGAQHIFYRKYTLNHFQSLPDPATTVCNECYESRLWANTLGGDETGEREAHVSLIKPWQEPNFGIKYRWRRHSRDSRSSPHTTASKSTLVVCPHLAPPPNTSVESPRGNLNVTATPATYEDTHGNLHVNPMPVDPKKKPLKSCLKNPKPPKVYRGYPAAGAPRSNSLISLVDWEEHGGIYPIISAPMMYISHPTFGPTRLNPPVSKYGVPGVLHTKNGRPVISWSHGKLKPPAFVEFPDRHLRVRFDSRTSLAPTKIPALDGQPTARLPKIVRPPTESVQPYIMVRSMAQDWEFSKYIITTTDPNDPGLQWLRKEGVAGEATLRADTLCLVSTRHSVNQMAKILASDGVTDEEKKSLRAIMVKRTLDAMPPLKSKQSHRELPTLQKSARKPNKFSYKRLAPDFDLAIDLSPLPTMIRKSTGEMAPAASALSDALRQARKSERSLAAFKNLQIAKYSPVQEPREKPREKRKAPLMDRGNTHRRAFRGPSGRIPTNNSKKSPDDVKLTAREKARQAAGAVYINPPEPERKKIGAPSPVEDEAEGLPILVNTDSMDTVVQEKTESMNTIEVSFPKSPLLFRPSSDSGLSRSFRESRMHSSSRSLPKASKKDFTSFSAPLPTINETTATLVDSTSDIYDIWEDCTSETTKEPQDIADTSAAAVKFVTKSSGKGKVVVSPKSGDRKSCLEESTKRYAQYLEEMKSLNVPSAVIGGGKLNISSKSICITRRKAMQAECS